VVAVVVLVVLGGWDGWMEVNCVGSSDADTKKGNEKEEKIRLFGQEATRRTDSKAQDKTQARQRT